VNKFHPLTALCVFILTVKSPQLLHTANSGLSPKGDQELMQSYQTLLCSTYTQPHADSQSSLHLDDPLISTEPSNISGAGAPMCVDSEKFKLCIQPQENDLILDFMPLMCLHCVILC